MTVQMKIEEAKLIGDLLVGVITKLGEAEDMLEDLIDCLMPIVMAGKDHNVEAPEAEEATENQAGDNNRSLFSSEPAEDCEERSEEVAISFLKAIISALIQQEGKR